MPAGINPALKGKVAIVRQPFGLPFCVLWFYKPGERPLVPCKALRDKLLLVGRAAHAVITAFMDDDFFGLLGRLKNLPGMLGWDDLILFSVHDEDVVQQRQLRPDIEGERDQVIGGECVVGLNLIGRRLVNGTAVDGGGIRDYPRDVVFGSGGQHYGSAEAAAE